MFPGKRYIPGPFEYNCAGDIIWTDKTVSMKGRTKTHVDIEGIYLFHFIYFISVHIGSIKLKSVFIISFLISEIYFTVFEFGRVCFSERDLYKSLLCV